MKPVKSTRGQGDLPKIGAPATRALAAAGFHSLKQLTRFTEAEVAAMHGVGPYAIGKLRIALAARGLAFAKKK